MIRRTVARGGVPLRSGACLPAAGWARESQPETVDRADVPFGLAERERSTPTTAPRVGVSYNLYFVAGDRLRPVTRTRDDDARPDRGPPQTGSGPGSRRQRRRVCARSCRRTSTIERVTVHDRIATVTLGWIGRRRTPATSSRWASPSWCSRATGLAGVDRVRFEVDGKPAEIPRGDGTLSTAPVDRADYPDGGAVVP